RLDAALGFEVRRWTGAGLASSAVAGAGSDAAAIGATCRLLITCFTPGSEAAYFEAASRCASVSTFPESATVPLAACTLICLFCNPESAPSFDWTSAVTRVSLGGLLRALASASKKTTKATRPHTDRPPIIHYPLVI